MSDILSPEITRLILEGIAALLGLALSWAVIVFKQKTGIDIQLAEQHNTDLLRRRLREVIHNGVSHAMTFAADEVRSRTDIALQYVLDGAVDTLAGLGVTDTSDIDLLRRRIDAEVKERSKPADHTSF